MGINIYDAQADTIDVDDIATDSNNRIVMRRIKRNNAHESVTRGVTSLFIQNQHDDDGEECIDYVPKGADDMGWLGYFVGKNHHLHDLHIRPFTPTSGSSVSYVIEPFFRGVNINKSIRMINFENVNLLGGEVFTLLGSFFQNNHNLTNIVINECDFGDEGARLFALAVGSSTNKSLKKVSLADSDISEEKMVDILTALSMHPHLKRVNFEGNHLGNNGCVALATLLRCSAKELQCLFISGCDVDDEGMEALVPALTHCHHLDQLSLSNNPSITTRGWQNLATILEAPNSNLEELYISSNNNDDEAAAAFANALTNNITLYTLNMIHNSITAVGWQSFSKVLCNTSSVNATFLSNHTLRYRGDMRGHAIIGPLLRLNRRDDKKEVAMIKILQNHADFNMQPFFEWEFKVLPMIIDWLERASECEMPENFEPNIEPRKLSTIYQFVRGMPVLYVETLLRKELEDLKAEASQMEEEELKLHQEFQEFQQRKQLLQKRKQLLEERKRSITKRIGKPKTN